MDTWEHGIGVDGAGIIWKRKEDGGEGWNQFR